MENINAVGDAKAFVLRAERTKRQRVYEVTDMKSCIPSDSDDPKDAVTAARSLGSFPEVEQIIETDNADPCENAPSDIKFTSRKFVRNGECGYYIYECKTCGKAFDSFQALGGHRASHGKPKYNCNKETRHRDGFRNKNVRSYPNIFPLSFRIGNHHFTEYKPKMHACGHCREQFSSGQALGGHMRKHRFSQDYDHDLFRSHVQQGVHQVEGQGKDVRIQFDLNLPPFDEEVQIGQEQHANQENGRLEPKKQLAVSIFGTSLVVAGCQYILP